jgi:hypothetical protein
MIEMINAVGYVALGFAGTFAAMEAAWKLALKGNSGRGAHAADDSVRPHVTAKAK